MIYIFVYIVIGIVSAAIVLLKDYAKHAVDFADVAKAVTVGVLWPLFAGVLLIGWCICVMDSILE